MSIRRLLAYGAIYFLWGGSFLGIRELVAVIPPFFAAGFRFTLAGLVLIGFSHLRGQTEMPRGSRIGVSTLGVIMFTLMYAALFWGEILVPSGIAAVISAMIPVWIFIGELAILRTQKATLLAVAGVVLGFAGVVVLAWEAPLSHSGSGARASTLAVLVLIGGTFCWSGGTLLSRRLTLPKPQTLNAGWQMAVGGGLLFLLSAMAGELRRLPALHVMLRPTLIFSMAYLVFAASIVTFTAYVWLIAHEPATRVASYAYVNPVVAVLVGYFLGGEALGVRTILGTVLVLISVVVITTTRRVPAVTRERT